MESVRSAKPLDSCFFIESDGSQQCWFGWSGDKVCKDEIMRSRFYRPELDALRFVAFLAVFAHHAPNVSSRTAASAILIRYQLAGELGMCLFFLLSAYLITELLLREYERNGRIRQAAFYGRRILRIWPLFF